jgi:hypothetical protein
MTSWPIVRLVAGGFILVSLALGVQGSPVAHSPWWLALTTFVGAKLLRSAFTRSCLMESVLCADSACARGPEAAGQRP